MRDDVFCKQMWHSCKECNSKIKDLAKKYGGGNIYYTTVFIKHLMIDHNMAPVEYFIKHGIQQKFCPCGCGNKCRVVKPNRKSDFGWSKLACGRNDGLLKWSEGAKIFRRGQGNPMYGKIAWNKGLTAATNSTVKTVRDNMVGRKMSEESKLKMSASAKKRKRHGHTGFHHTEENKQKSRERTLKMIVEGKFKQTKSRPHIKMQKILEDLSIYYIEEYRIECWSFDFYLPDKSIYIEVDGDYFHSNPTRYPNGPKTKTQKINFYRDTKKNLFCQEHHLHLLRFWENDILNNEDSVKEIIKCNMKE